MLPLFFRQLSRVMTFARGENEKQTGKRRERKQPKTKHARGE
jgi:hypothetical protein